MKTKYIAAVVTAAVAALAALLLTPSTVAYDGTKDTAPQLTHAQEVWISALEWCESRGVMTAINPKDRDNTPSYYSWQWKPSTFEYYGKIYGVVPKDATLEQATALMAHYNAQRALITAMVLDGKHINWSQQFPDCVLHKVGRPPLQ